MSWLLVCPAPAGRCARLLRCAPFLLLREAGPCGLWGCGRALLQGSGGSCWAGWGVEVGSPLEISVVGVTTGFVSSEVKSQVGELERISQLFLRPGNKPLKSRLMLDHPHEVSPLKRSSFQL